jgi:SAM-dependent methyltransferase
MRLMLIAYDRFTGGTWLCCRCRWRIRRWASRQRVLDGATAPARSRASQWSASKLSAVDPSEEFVAAARERHPGVDVRRAGVEEPPFTDGEFDEALAQLVVHLMADHVRGLVERVRVMRVDGVLSRTSGITPAGRRRWRVLGRPLTSWTLTQRTNGSSQAVAKAISLSFPSTPACAMERLLFRFVSGARASRG